MISANTLLNKSVQRKISGNWKHWIAQKDLKTCEPCSTMHGKIFPMRQLLSVRPPLHPFCRCVIRPLEAISAGYATQDGRAGADYWLKNYGLLPNAYITKEAAKQAGWIPKEGNFDGLLPGRIVGGDI